PSARQRSPWLAPLDRHDFPLGHAHCAPRIAARPNTTFWCLIAVGSSSRSLSMLMSRIGCPASVALLLFVLPASTPAQTVSGGVSGGIIQGPPGGLQGAARYRVP